MGGSLFEQGPTILFQGLARLPREGQGGFLGDQVMSSLTVGFHQPRGQGFAILVVSSNIVRASETRLTVSCF